MKGLASGLWQAVGGAAALLLLAGCAPRLGPPAPVEYLAGAAPTAALAPGPALPGRITVAPGETLYGVARRYGVPARALIEANHLTPPYRLASGAKLNLPPLHSAAVPPGVAQTTAVPPPVRVAAAVPSQPLAPPHPLPPARPSWAAAPATMVAAKPSAPSQPATSVTTASVRPPPSWTAAPIRMAASRPPRPTPIAETPVADIQSTRIAPPPAAVPPSTPGFAGWPQPVRRSVAQVLPPRPPPQAEPAALPAETRPAAVSPVVATLPPPTLPPLADTSFVWPVRGRILSSFGSGPDGTRNDGINIAAPAGTPVLAAAAGTVAYAGNELRGYGNLILIKHAGGFITAYAHNSVLLVRRGEAVRRGEIIARIGATGAVAEPQLHFEIRRGTRSLDPSGYLPALSADAKN